MFLKNSDIVHIKRLLKLLKPYTKKIIYIFVCIILSSGIAITLPFISKQIMDKGLLPLNIKIVMYFSLLTLLLVIIDNLISIIETKNRTYINAVMVYDLNKTALKHAMKLKLDYFNKTNFAEIMNNINADIGNISKITDRGTFYIISSLFRIIGGIIGLVVIDLRLTMFVIMILPFRYLIAKYLAAKRRKYFEDYMKSNKEYSSWYGDTIGGIKEIKLFGLETIKTGQFIKKQRKVLKTNIRMSILDAFYQLTESMLFQILTSGLYILGIYMLVDNSLTLGGLFAFITYSMHVTAPITAILNIGYNFSSIIPSAKRFYEFLDKEEEEDKRNKALINTPLNYIKGNISFENVSFSYREDKKVLDNVSFNIEAGEKVAIIGLNGSGKTTLTNLLLRFIDPEQGEIKIGDININRFKLKNYRSIFAVVSQNAYLFNDTIKNNIMCKSTFKEIKMHKATKDSGAAGFIERLALKYDSDIGRDGASISGGERQKIALARALMKEARILILDEATSNYDTHSEENINSIIENNDENRTIIVITHRLNVLKKMDKVIILNNGVADDIGSHSELLERNEIYKTMLMTGS